MSEQPPLSENELLIIKQIKEKQKEIFTLQTQINLRITDIAGLEENEQLHTHVTTEISKIKDDCQKCLEYKEKWKEEITVREREITEQKTTIEELRELANRDELTQAYNRRHFNNIYKKALKETLQTPGKIFSFAIIDINDFKLINDNHSHVIGDEALKLVSKILQEKLDELGSKAAMLFRYGGDEFVILSRRKKESIVKIINSVILELKISTISTETESIENITLSAGISEYSSSFGTNGNSLIENADNKCYKAKDLAKTHGTSYIIYEDTVNSHNNYKN